VNSILYVNKVGDDGWLKTRDSDPAQFVCLPKYTRLGRVESKNGRAYFSVLDGAAKGKVVSLSDGHISEYLGPRAPLSTPAHIVVTYGKYVTGWISKARNGESIDQQMATLEVANMSVTVTMNSVWDGRFSPIAPGTYSVLLPDTPHRGGMTAFYRHVAPRLKYDRVWFPIKHGDNSRYIHVGNLSDGCATVLDLDRWPEVHEALVSHRGSDGMTVGQVIVKGAPERAR
jgi:hypothetical protein